MKKKQKQKQKNKQTKKTHIIFWKHIKLQVY